MELWIRSQDKTTLIKVNKILFERNIGGEPTIYGYEKYDNYERLGVYNTKERALEVLDEIQNKITNKYIYECGIFLKKEDMDSSRIELNKLYDSEFIMQPPSHKITPINGLIVIYEMPKE